MTKPALANRVRVGDQFPTLALTPVSGDPVSIPDPAGALIHLQFRRFAGCPICNLHLRSITARLDDIRAADIEEVVVFHSTAEELGKYQDDMPFAVIPDQRKPRSARRHAHRRRRTRRGHQIRRPRL